MIDYGKDVISEPIRIFDQTEDIPSSFRIIDAESILHLAINAKAHLTFRFYRTCGGNSVFRRAQSITRAALRFSDRGRFAASSRARCFADL